MADSPSIEQIVAQIRTAIYGRDVRENIALGIEKCHEDAEDALQSSDIANNLTTTAAGKVLDARQGKVLYDKYGYCVEMYPQMVYSPSATRSSVLTNLNNANDNTIYHFLMASTSTLPDNYPTTAQQLTEFLVLTLDDSYTSSGTAYNYKIQCIINVSTFSVIAVRIFNDTWGAWTVISVPLKQSDVANNLTTTAAGKVLDARQGKILNDKIAGFISTDKIANNHTTTESGYVLDARQGKYLYDQYGKCVEDFDRMVYSPSSTRSSVLTNLNNANVNTWYHFLMASTSTLPDNYPSSGPQLTEFLVFTFSDIYTSGGTDYNYRIQYVFDVANYRAIAKRIFNDTWGAWTIISDPNGAGIEKVVATDGSGDYTTVTAAVAAASSGDIIFVRKGTYNNEVIRAWGKNITIRGEDRNQTILRNGYNDYDRPVLEMDIGCLENLTLYSYDGGGAVGQYGPGYGLHIEHNSMANNSFTARDVTFKSDKNNGAGIGLRPGCSAEFYNCLFYSHDVAGIFYHDCATGAVGVQNISFISCTFYTVSGTESILINSQKFTGSTVYNTFINCNVANASGTPPIVKAVHGTSYTGDATGPIGDFYKLINFFHGKLSHGNNVAGLNIWDNDLSLFPQMAYLGGATNIISDFNDALPNVIYLINCSNSSQLPAHSPSTSLLTFYVLTMETSFVSGGTTYYDRMQYAFDKSTLQMQYVREYVDSWSAWSAIPSPSGVTVVDNLTSTSTTSALSANQGKVLKGLVDKAVNHMETASDCCDTSLIAGCYRIINTTTNTPESGMYGVLFNMIGNDYVTQIVISTSTDNIYYRKNRGSGTPWNKVLTGNNVVNNLTSTSTTAVLSAYQGRVLNEKLTSKTDFTLNIPSGWTISDNYAYKKAGFVCASGLLTANADVTGKSLDFGIVIPSGYRPSSSINFNAYDFTSNDPYWGIINDEGRFIVYRTMTTATRKIYFTVMYPID